MHHQKRRNPIWNDESVAQQVEHNTFNVGVPGSSPGGFTQTTTKEGGRFVFMVIRSVLSAEILNLAPPFYLYGLFYYICVIYP